MTKPTLVVDASVAIAASHSPVGFAALRRFRPGHAAAAPADRMGRAKTYDAHYVTLADHLGCKLLTLDERLIRGIARLGLAVRPQDL